jgi:adenine/guanine phosphoribosyltransferase-like PRPP-binding protein
MEIDRALVIESFDRKPLVPVNGRKFLINSLTEQVPATSTELLRETTRWIVSEGNFQAANKIVGEEDKGGILVASTSLLTNLPFGMARWYPSGLEGQIVVDFEMEYTSGQLYLNGVSDGDYVVLVDDMISTGGTMLALIEAVHQARGKIVDIVCVAEKVEYSGVPRVLELTGYKVKTLVKISVAGQLSRVISS